MCSISCVVKGVPLHCPWVGRYQLTHGCRSTSAGAKTGLILIGLSNNVLGKNNTGDKDTNLSKLLRQ